MLRACAKALRWECVWFVGRIRRKPVWLELSEQRGVGRLVIKGGDGRVFQTTQTLTDLGKNCGFYSKFSGEPGRAWGSGMTRSD